MIRLNSNNLNRSSWLSVTLVLASIVLVIGILYWGREVLIPIALAILLTFILAPMVTLLRRWGLGRTLAVTITVVFAFALLGVIGTMIVVEFRSLANDLPAYRHNIRKKISDLRVASKGGSIEKVQEMVKEAVDEFKKDEPAAANDSKAVPVVITEGPVANQPGVPIIGSLLEQLASAGLVIVLVIFMLLRREDLRDRLLRLAGYGRLAAATKAIDETGKGVSKYLLRQCLLNAGFGVAIGVGLFLIGLPYAVLWGFLAAVARFIPYAGPWLGALAPILTSLAVFDGWTAPLLVIGLVVGLELLNNMILEPMLYGNSIGVSEVALLIMIAFWTWLWGPIGMVLATPLTVCLMVISKGVPDLEFIGLLLSSEPALKPHRVFYQRLVAKDQDEAQEIVEAFLQEHSRTELFEQLLLPALVSCRLDYRRSRLTGEDQEFVFRAIRQIVEETEQFPTNGVEASESSVSESSPLSRSSLADRPLLVGCPANDEADELALMMLVELLRAEHWPMRVLSSEMLSSETFAELEKAQPAVVCVGFLTGAPRFPVRQFCKRLRSRFPKLPIIAGCWGTEEPERMQHQLSDLVDAISWSLTETQNQIVQFVQITVAAEAGNGDGPQASKQRLAFR